MEEQAEPVPEIGGIRKENRFLKAIRWTSMSFNRKLRRLPRAQKQFNLPSQSLLSNHRIRMFQSRQKI